MIKSLGADETTESPAFKQRTKKQDTRRSNSCTKIKSEWAEIKTSALVKTINHDDRMNGYLTGFLQGILQRLTGMLNLTLPMVITEYNGGLKVAIQKDKRRSYPVAQSQAWIDDPGGIFHNLYGLVNIVKWFWYQIKFLKYYDPVSCRSSPVLLYSIIDLLQQRFLLFMDAIRGDRLNYKPKEGKTSQIGIGNFSTPELKREVRGKEKLEPEPWLHPGNVQCRVPYRGGYGKRIKEYADTNSFFASLECGISGSTQYTYFMFLLSLVKGPILTGEKANEEMRNIILTQIMTLAGDGGHNAREVIFGTTCTTILLRNFISDFQNDLAENLRKRTFQENVDELQKLQNVWSLKGCMVRRTLEFILEGLPDLLCNQKTLNRQAATSEIFKELASALVVWQPLIEEIYKFTSDINIVGVYREDLNEFDPGYGNPDQFSAGWYACSQFHKMKKGVFDVLFDRRYGLQQMYSLESSNAVNQFFALENGRFLLDPMTSFKKAGDIKIRQVVEEYETGKEVLEKTNKKLDKILKECLAGRPIHERVSKIPFAFR